MKFLTDQTDTKIDDLDEDYRLKFTGFINALVKTHLHRLIDSPEFPLSAFMELLYQYTFQQPNVHAMRECLTIWSFFVKYIEEQHVAGKTAISERFKSGLLAFANQLVMKMQYSHNPSELSDIEDNEENDDGQTDYDVFLDELLDIIACLVSLYPSDLIPQFYAQMEVLETSFVSICQSSRNDSRPIAETARIHYVFKDMRTFLRVFGRLSETFCGNFEMYFSSTFSMLENFLGVMRVALSAFASYADFGDFPKLCAEFYTIYQAYIHWTASFCQQCRQSPELEPKFDLFISTLLGACIAVFQKSVPERIEMAASQLFQSICLTVKPPKMFTYPKIGELMSNLHETALPLSNTVKQNLYRAAANACLNLLSKNESEVSSQFNSFVRGLTEPFVELSKNNNFFDSRMFQDVDVRSKIVHVIVVITALIESVQGEKQAIKQVMFESIKDALPFTLLLFRNFVSDAEFTGVLMNMFVALFGSLRKQVGVATASQMFQEFASVLDSSRIKQFLTGDSLGADLLIRFMDLLKIIVEDNSRAFDSLTGNVLVFCVDQCGKNLSELYTSASLTVAASYFPLVHSVLLHNWKYFFTSNITNSLNAQNNPVDDQPKRMDQFWQLFDLMRYYFSTPNLDIFRMNLAIMEDLNTKCRLFTNEFFQQKLYVSLSTTILMALCGGSHSSLRDEINHTVFTMASTNPATFKTQVLEEVLAKNNVPREMWLSFKNIFDGASDLGSFSTAMEQFTGDISVAMGGS